MSCNVPIYDHSFTRNSVNWKKFVVYGVRRINQMADLLIVVGDHEDSAAYDSYDALKRRLRCKVALVTSVGHQLLISI